VISELDRYQGVVLRQIVVAYGGRVEVGLADVTGRKDCFSVARAAFQIKHCRNRLSPWHFTYQPENFGEIEKLRAWFDPVWVFLVCGADGVVGLSADELISITEVGDGGQAWVRVSRSRSSMYRVSGARGELPRAKARGVQAFVADLVEKTNI